MVTRSDVLVATAVADGAYVVSQVPVGETWIVKSLAVQNNSAVTGTAVVNLQRAGVVVRLVSEELASGDGAIIESWVVANDDDQVVCAAYGTECNFWVSGARLVP